MTRIDGRHGTTRIYSMCSPRVQASNPLRSRIGLRCFPVVQDVHVADVDLERRYVLMHVVGLMDWWYGGALVNAALIHSFRRRIVAPLDNSLQSRHE